MGLALFSGLCVETIHAGDLPLIPLLPENAFGQVEAALDALVMKPSDVRFEKDHGKPIWALGWITNSLTDPWQYPGVAEKIFSAAATGEADGLWEISASLLELPAAEKPRMAEAADPKTLEQLASNVVAQMQNVREALQKSFGPLSAPERTYLSASIFSPSFETEDRGDLRPVLELAGMPRDVQLQVEHEGQALDGTEYAKSWLALVGKMDRAQLHLAGRLLHEAVVRAASEAAGISRWPDSPRTVETALGKIVFGTKGSDNYQQAALLIIDPGGDDVYSGSAGAANGLLAREIAAVIDLGGNDRYASEHLIGAGGALWGVAAVLDENGDDIYQCAGAGLGSGIFGAAWLEDLRGRDFYSARAFAEGSGVAGFGFHIDRAGDDLFDVGFQGQGFSGVMGWGLLFDAAGHDRYSAGRVLKDHERNDERFLSLSQGFSIGMRPHAGGGVAALIDLTGNDSYNADVYGQGVSYYYAAGMLMDGEGNDTYQMYQYGQGCGIHMSLGLLADASGSDTYTGYILSQGAAHDYAAGFLFDHAGDDTYTADHHAQGRGLNNAFALLLDRSGTDGYFARQRGEAQGVGNGGGFRDYGSLGLLVDLNGMDVYSGGMSNNISTLRPLYGVVHDREVAGDE